MKCLSEAETMLQNAMHAIDNPAISAVTCTPDYLAILLDPTKLSLENLQTAYSNYIENVKTRGELIRNSIHTAWALSVYLIQAKATSNTSTDITFGDSECILKFSQNYILICYRT